MQTNTLSTITCPVSAERVNESVVRLSAFLVVLLSLLALFIQSYGLMLILAIDFGLRAFTIGKWSVLKQFSMNATQWLKLPQKLTDAAPKKFAAAVGFMFCLGIAICLYFGLLNTAYTITAVLLICAFLESFAGYCVGCQVYSWVYLPLKKAFF
ncbi:MAG: DUF4395 domain-containing protein [Cytophagales bacterium]|nr:MAG: DUF4395 domain-containing protein [Cytophagales bacterium]